MVKKPQKYPSLTVYKRIAYAFTGLVATVLLFLFYFTLIRAEIVIALEKFNFDKIFYVTVIEGENITVENYGQVLSGKIKELEISGTSECQSTGELLKKSDVSAKITIVNNNSTNQPLVQRTRFVSPNGVLFRIRESVIVPRKGSLEVEIFADNTDEVKSDIPSGKFTIPGLSSFMQNNVWGELSEAVNVSGEKVAIVREEDITSCENRLKDNLSNEASQRILSEMSAESLRGFGQVDKIFQLQVVEKTKSNLVGDEVDKFTMDMTIEVGVVYFDKNELLKLLEKNIVLDNSDQSVAYLDNNQLNVRLAEFDAEANKATVEIGASGYSQLDKSSSLLSLDELRGRNVYEAANELKSHKEIKEVKIKIFPSWAKKLPKKPSHIKIVFL